MNSVIDKIQSPGIVSIDMAGQVFTHKLRHTPLSPADNAIVLDLASPLYDPGAVIDGVSKIYDRSGYGNHGTIFGATWKQFPSGLTYLNHVGGGADDYVDIPVTGLETLETGTVLLWVLKTADETTEEALFSISNNASGVFTEFFLSYDLRASKDYLTVAVNVDGTTQWNAHTAVNSTDPWIAKPILIGISHNGTVPTVCVNGVSQALTYVDETNKTKWFKAILTDATTKADVMTLGGLRRNGSVLIDFKGDTIPLRITGSAITEGQQLNIYNQERHLFGR